MATPRGGERPITQLCNIVLIWGRCRRQQGRDWCDAQARHWDDAIAGNSALRSNIQRSLMSETGAYLGLKAATVHWDMEKFYDSLDLRLIVRSARATAYPLRPLFLSLLTDLGPRYLVAQNHCSEAIHTSNSITAGDAQANNKARCLLYQILDHVHCEAPRAPIRQYADDLTQRAEGHQNSLVADAIVQGATCLHNALLANKLTPAQKTTIVATSSELANGIQRRLRIDTGLSVRVARVARDLGIDNSESKSRRAPTGKKRWVAGLKRAVKTKSIVKDLKTKTGAIFRASVANKMTYHATIMGLAPRSMAAMRSLTATTAALAGTGRCVSSVLGFMGHDKDPGHYLRRLQIKEWLRFWSTHHQHHARLRRTWHHACEHIIVDGSIRWLRVRGFLSAVIACVFEAGWEPTRPDRWISPDGLIWQAAAGLADPTDLLNEMARGWQKTIWQQAAKHYMGGGLENGADFTPVARLHRKLLKRRRFAEAGALLCVALGASWPLERCQLAGYDVPTLCPRCHKAPETALHRTWHCEADSPDDTDNKAFTDSAIYKHEAIQACTDGSGGEAFWCRGLPPLTWVANADFCDDIEHTIGIHGRTLELPRHIATCYLDGSVDDGDPRVRRGGWSAAFLSSTPLGPDLCGAWFGTLPGYRQTTDRAELYALTKALNHTDGTSHSCSIFISDCDYVVAGFRNKRWIHSSGTNHDLWDMVGTSMRTRLARNLSTVVVWTKSHVTPELMAHYAIPAVDVIGNEIADALAKRGAALHSLAECTRKLIERADHKAHAVLRRIVKAQILASEAQPRAARKHPRVATDAGEPQLIQQVRNSCHFIIKDGSRWKCGRCNQQAPTRDFRAWLKGAKCEAVVAGPSDKASKQRAAISADGEISFSQPVPVDRTHIGSKSSHVSHRLVAWRGITWCWSCGSYATLAGSIGELKGLANQCGTPNRGKRHVLARLRKGLPPRADMQWPLTS